MSPNSIEQVEFAFNRQKVMEIRQSETSCGLPNQPGSHDIAMLPKRLTSVTLDLDARRTTRDAKLDKIP